MPVVIGRKPESTFADPIGLLGDCHRRIERFLSVLVQVATEAHGGSLSDDQRSAWNTALRYFREAAPKHTADEEESLCEWTLWKSSTSAPAKLTTRWTAWAGCGSTTAAFHSNKRPGSPPCLGQLSELYGRHIAMEEGGAINPMELYHNQVTRAQGAFSLCMFYRSWGLMMIQENISAPSTLLDFLSREDFASELTSCSYDIVGISSIIVNIGKVREMCRMVRELPAGSTIVVGGHVTAIPGIEHMVDANHFVRGDGISWMRRFLGEDAEQPIRHPVIV